LALAAASQPASPQGWPAKPLRLVVALPAGSGADMVARLVSAGLAERLKQPVVVENRPGAAENIGMEAVARSAPDGYTLLLAVTSLVTNPHLYRLNYDPLKDLVPVTQLARTHYVLVAHPSLPAKTVRETLALAKARPGIVTCAHASGALHVACAWLKAAGRADITLVPYKGSGQALNDVIGGHADLVFGVVHTVAPYAQSNRLRVLATTNPRRGSGPFGSSPTMAETLPGFELVSWLGVMAPAGTPREIVTRLNREIAAALEQEDARKRIMDGGLEPAHGPPEAFAELIQRDYARLGKIIRETGIRVE
jgi:tripartite-type tricarboxylate transporter receptor subunit TctC